MRNPAALIVALLASLALFAGSGRATATATTVVNNPNFLTLAVDASGTSWGLPIGDATSLSSSSDEGATWTTKPAWHSTFGRRLWYLTPLPNGTLLAAYDTGYHWNVARSGDRGSTWQSVLSLPCTTSDCTRRYLTLTPRSIVSGDGYVFLGTYSNMPGSPWANYIYRSADDGRTWSVTNTTTTHRHIHGLLFDNHKLFVFFGDSPGDGTWASSDAGVTLAPLCTDYQCTFIEGAPVGNGSFVAATDNPNTTNHVYSVNESTGSRTNLLDMPYDSYSAGRTSAGILTVAETHEGGASISDPNLKVFASDDNGRTWATISPAARLARGRPAAGPAPRSTRSTRSSGSPRHILGA